MRIFAGSEERSHKSAVFRLRLAIGVPGELFEGLPVSDMMLPLFERMKPLPSGRGATL